MSGNAAEVLTKGRREAAYDVCNGTSENLDVTKLWIPGSCFARPGMTTSRRSTP